MANTFRMNAAALSTIGALEKDVNQHKGERSKALETINAAKVTQYATLSAEIWSLPLQKGKLSRKNRDVVAAQLAAEAGIDINKGSGKRLYDGAVAISKFRKKLDMPTQATAEAIEAQLIRCEMTSEAKIRAELFPSASNDPVKQVVRQFVGAITWSNAKSDSEEPVPNGWKPGTLAERLQELRNELAEAEIIAQKIAENAQKAEEERIAVAELLADFVD